MVYLGSSCTRAAPPTQHHTVGAAPSRCQTHCCRCTAAPTPGGVDRRSAHPLGTPRACAGAAGTLAEGGAAGAWARMGWVAARSLQEGALRPLDAHTVE